MNDSGFNSDIRVTKRKLTPFLAHEMLYDFVTDNLDSERKSAIEEFIKTDRESQNLIEAIRLGIQYSESLNSIHLGDAYLSELEQAENLTSLSKKLSNWREWPDSLRWSILALGISAVTAAAIVLVPWKSVPLFTPGSRSNETTVEIAKIDSKIPSSDDPNSSANSNIGDTGEIAQDNPPDSSEGSGDEEFAEEASGVMPNTSVGGSPITQPGSHSGPGSRVETPSSSLNKAGESKSSTPPLASNAAPPAPKTSTTRPAATSAPAAAPSTKSSTGQGRGFVYRAFMTLPDLENVGPKITQQIKELGAEKAGEVELGWKRGTGRYYHFSLPEANEQKLLEALRAYGPVRVSKDPHPRQMPEGEIRFILWIESGS